MGRSTPECALLERVRDQLLEVRHLHPQWHAEYEDIDPFTAERPAVEGLLQSAPTDFARGLVTGLLLMRQQMAVLTGRRF